MGKSRAWIVGTAAFLALLLPVAWAAAQHDHGAGDTTATATPAPCPAASPSAHSGHGQQASAETCSPYAAGFSAAASIRALTPEEIAEIENGEGAGFAKPAELNGVPGPRHVLDLAAELDLSDDQRTQVQTIYDEMKAAVISAGRRYLSAQQALEEDFRAGAITEADLPRRVGEVYRLRGEVAAIHLSAHLETAQILTPAQIDVYNRLRGYE